MFLRDTKHRYCAAKYGTILKIFWVYIQIYVNSQSIYLISTNSHTHLMMMTSLTGFSVLRAYLNHCWNMFSQNKYKKHKRQIHLKLQFHSGDSLSGRDLCVLLNVRVQVASGDFCVATCCSFQQGLMDEYVLILCLHHVVPLSSHARHVAVYVHWLLVLHPLQHSVNHDEAARPAHTSTDKDTTEVWLEMSTVLLNNKILAQTKMATPFSPTATFWQHKH